MSEEIAVYCDYALPPERMARVSLQCRIREIRTLPLWISDGPLRNHMITEGIKGVLK